MAMTPRPVMKVTSYGDLQELYESVRTVLDAPDGVAPELRSLLERPIRRLESTAVFRDGPTGQKVLAIAQEIKPVEIDHEEIQIDQEAIVYHNGDDGYWVLAWLFVSDTAMEDDPEEEPAELG